MGSRGATSAPHEAICLSRAAQRALTKRVQRPRVVGPSSIRLRASAADDASDPMHKLTHFRLCPVLARGPPRARRARHRGRAHRGAALGVAAGVPGAQPGGRAARAADRATVPRCAASTRSRSTSARRRPSDPDEDAASCRSFPGPREERAEVRRLVDWFNGKFNREVTQELLNEKVYARLQPGASPTPDADILRAIRSNLRYHMSYISHLARPAALAGGRRAVVCRSRRRRACIVGRLSGRGAMGGVRDRQGLVRALEVAARVPLDPGRSRARRHAGDALRQSRLLTASHARASSRGPPVTADLKETLRREAPRLGLRRRARHHARRHRPRGRAPHGVPRCRPPRRHDLARHDRRPPPRIPARLWPEARSVVMLAMSYAPDADPLAALDAALARRHLGLRARQGLPRHPEGQAQDAGREPQRQKRRRKSRSSSIPRP